MVKFIRCQWKEIARYIIINVKIEEVKSFPRLFEMLLKDGSITKAAERLGKIFTYRY